MSEMTEEDLCAVRTYGRSDNGVVFGGRLVRPRVARSEAHEIVRRLNEAAGVTEEKMRSTVRLPVFYAVANE